MGRFRSEYEVWRDELAADQRRHTVADALLELLIISAFYAGVIGAALLLSHYFGGRA